MKSLTRWEPFRLLGNLDPLDDLRTMQQEMDMLFNRFLGRGLPVQTETWMPAVESYTKEGQLIFRAELPGLNPKDLDVSINENRELVIKGERKAEKNLEKENYIHTEISYGRFERRFMLPDGIKTEDLKAKFENGILEVAVPVARTATARKIEIEIGKPERKVLEGEAKKAA